MEVKEKRISGGFSDKDMVQPFNVWEAAEQAWDRKVQGQEMTGKIR